MTVVIDTNSLVSLVRYYLPFDENSVLSGLIKAKIEQGEIIIIDKVFEQCSYQSRGIVIQRLEYLSDKTFLKSAGVPRRTDELLAPAPAKFLRQVDNQFANRPMTNKLTDVEYEVQKNKFLNDADAKMIILCLNLQQQPNSEVIIVTEETERSNDNKFFKKIPAICKELDIVTLTLPQLLSRYQNEVRINFNGN